MGRGGDRNHVEWVNALDFLVSINLLKCILSHVVEYRLISIFIVWGIFDEYNYSEEDEVVRSNLRNICRGANLHTLNLVAKENTPVVIPHVEFKFETVGGVEGKIKVKTKFGLS